jgi:hypothetical protein
VEFNGILHPSETLDEAANTILKQLTAGGRLYVAVVHF